MRNIPIITDRVPHGDAGEHTKNVKRLATVVRGRGDASLYTEYIDGVAYSTGVDANKLLPPPPYGVLSFPLGYLQASPMDFSGDFTIEWFMKPSSFATDSYQNVFTILKSDGNLNFLNFTLDNNGTEFFEDSTGARGVLPLGTFGNWCHYAVCRTAGLVTVYIHGIRASDPVFYDSTDSGPIQIGHYPEDPPFIGSITNFRITTGVGLYIVDSYSIPDLPLSGGNLLLLAKTEKDIETDYSGYNQAVSIIGSPSWERGPVTSYIPYGVLGFETGHLEVPPMDFSGDFTIEWVMKLGSRYSFQNAFTILTADGTSNFLNFYTGFSNVTDAYSGILDIPTINNRIRAILPLGAYDNWHHYVVSRTSGQVKILINGSRYIQTTYDREDAGIIQVGYRVGYTPMTGRITNFRITTGVSLYGDTYTIPNLPLSGGNLLLLATSVPDLTKNFASRQFNASEVGYVSWTPGPIPVSFPLYGVLGFRFGHFESPPMNFSGDFTVEWFMKYIPPSDTTRSQFVFAVEEADGNPTFLGFYYNNTGTYEYVSGASTTMFTPGAFIRDWYHYAVCRKNGELGLYMNGYLWSSLVNYTNTTIGKVLVGYYDDQDRLPITSLISNFRVTLGTALYDCSVLYDEYTVPSVPLSGGDLLLLAVTQPTRAIDSSYDPLNIVEIGNVGWSVGDVIPEYVRPP